MNELLNKEKRIEDLVYVIRGIPVMLDTDIAMLYGVETKRINEAVKNNIERFPERYVFRITENESNILKSKISTSNRGGSRKGHNVFTEQGATMLATVLKSKTAVKVSIQIIDAFVYMRNHTNSYLKRISNLETKYIEHDNEIKLLQSSFDKFSDKSLKNEIYFDGQIYDAYSKIIDIMSETKKELIIIDAYADKTVLDMISALKVKTILITKDNNKLSKLDIEKYNSQYNNLKVVYDDTFHDRYLVLDNSIVYHCGASINHAGSKTFSINKIEDSVIIKSLISRINEL